MLLYYITDRAQFPGDETARRRCLLDNIAEAARCGVDYIQLREKDLPTRELEQLSREAVELVKDSGARLLINSRIDVALATGAHGVHLRSHDIAASDARAMWAMAGGSADYLVAVSCHSAQEVALAESHGADFAVFAPVFEKGGRAGVGLEALRRACTGRVMPVLALGGITAENAQQCIRAGAAGIAAIRLFQDNDIAGVLKALKSSTANHQSQITNHR